MTPNIIPHLARGTIMPVAVRKSPFTGADTLPLRTPQVRCLAALIPDYPNDPVHEWPVFTRSYMRIKCGLSTTNSMNRILHGIKSGPGQHQGLIELGLVEIIVLDIEGTIEDNYRITPKGVQCLSHIATKSATKSE